MLTVGHFCHPNAAYNDRNWWAGGSIERWEEKTFRKCFQDILSGDWRRHDPYELEGRLDAKTSLYGRPDQVSAWLENR